MYGVSPPPPSCLYIFCRFSVIIIRSGNTLLACGFNLYQQISADSRRQFTTPSLLDLPGSVVKVALFHRTISIQLMGGAWVGRGLYSGKYFAPVPKADLIDGRCLPGWNPVSDQHSASLDNLTLAEPNLVFWNVMVVPSLL